MIANPKLAIPTVCTALVLGSSLLWITPPCSAQATTPTASSATPTATPDTGDGLSNENHWVISNTGYLWLPAVHGTVGALGRSVGVHVSIGELFDHFKFGIATGFLFRYNRIVAPIDFLFLKVSDDHSLPFPNLNVQKADIDLNFTMFTPKLGFRMVDKKGIKIDAVSGLRYLHLSEGLSFSPSTHGLNVTGRQNLVDPLVGANTTINLTPNIVIWINGDVGGWGAASQLEYQIIAALGYRKTVNMTMLKHKVPSDWMFQVGYRYWDINWSGSGNKSGVVDMAYSGPVIGATVVLRKPN